MDEDRRVRFFVAPALMIASLLWGAWFDPNGHAWIIGHLSIDKLPSLIGLVAGGGFAVFAFGYVIGTLTYFILRLTFWIKSKLVCRFKLKRWGKSRFHEVSLSDDALKEIWRRLGREDTATREQELSAAVAFDHGFLLKNHEGVYEGVHLWLVRRWSAVSIGATSAVGLLLSFVLGCKLFNISFQVQWWGPVGGFVAILIVVARSAWYDTMKMLTFMAGQNPPPASKSSP